jgi:hypothetical protein
LAPVLEAFLLVAAVQMPRKGLIAACCKNRWISALKKPAIAHVKKLCRVLPGLKDIATMYQNEKLGLPAGIFMQQLSGLSVTSPHSLRSLRAIHCNPAAIQLK